VQRIFANYLKNTTNRAAMCAGLFVTLISTAQAVAQPGLESTRPTTEVLSCITSGCHSDISDTKIRHAPVVQSKCLSCHEYALPEEHLFVLSKPGNDLCLDCHKLPQTDRVIHDPVAKGQCLSCHDPHGSENPDILLKAPDKGLCLDCHQENYSEFEFVHGPVAVGACVICHESHSSSFESLLKDRPSRICLNCHEELKPSPAQARHLHKPMEDGCIACHDPHASNAPFQLESAVPELCIKCHDWFPQAIETALVTHAPVTTEGGCTQCHNPHFSALPRLQKQTQPELCLKCHDKPIKTDDGRTLMDMRTFLNENPDHHGPIREGSCTMCHHPHTSQEANLLVQAYPPEFYTPFSIKQYELCFTCHQSDLVTDKNGTGLTQFRQGDENLHYLHVNREKGRTCRACHDVHASKRPAHIRESVPFGSSGWLLDINFEKFASGGSCSPGCHKAKTYSRVEPPTDPSLVGQSPVTNTSENESASP
jgi:predicted CXXCH cytochrome family protein